jgi:hypothetical protein
VEQTLERPTKIDGEENKQTYMITEMKQNTEVLLDLRFLQR